MAQKMVGAAPSGTTDFATKGEVDTGDLVMSNAVTTTTYTLALTDSLNAVDHSNASASTITIPPNSSVAFPVGAIVEIAQQGAGQVTIAAGSGVTLHSAGTLVKTRAQYSAVSIRQIAANTWLLAGDLA